MRKSGINKLTYDVDFSEIIPTRLPRDGEPTMRVSIKDALEIADEFYRGYVIGGRNAEYCRRKYQEGRS